MAETTPLGAQNPYKPTIQPLQEFDFKPTKSQGSGKFRQYATAIIVNVSALAAGSVAGWPSPSGPVLKSLDTPMEASPVSEEDMSWLASINYLTAIAGTLAYGVLADTIGRRLTGVAVAVPFVLCWVLIAASSDLWLLYVARVLGGIANGGAMVVCPLYVSETADDENRGPLGTFLAVGINSGILFAFVVGAVTSYRVLPLVCLSLPVLFAAGILYLPETPMYLVKRGRMGRALTSLQWYRGGPGQHVETELQRMQAASKRETDSTVTFRDLFLHRGTRRALVTSVVLFANQQLCGVIAVLSYTEEIFRDAGSTLDPAYASIIVGIVQAVMTYLSSLLVNHMGRKTLVIISNAVMAVSISVLGGCFYAKSIGQDFAGIGWLPVASMSLYVIFFALGLGPIPLVMLGETYSTKVRSRATSIGVAVQALSAFSSIKLITAIQGRFGMHGSLWFFALCCVAGIVFAVFYIIETRGKTLEHILREYNGEPIEGNHQVPSQVGGDGESSDRRGSLGPQGVPSDYVGGRAARYVLLPTSANNPPETAASDHV